MKWMKALAAVLGLVISLDGCGAQPAADPAAQVFSGPQAVPEVQPERLRVLLAMPGLADPAMLGLARGMQDACDLAGVEVIVDDAGGDAALQGENIAVFITSGGDAVACWPVDEAALAPYVESAEAEGLAVIGVNAGFAAVESTLLLDGAAAGQQLAGAAAALWESPATARGTVLVLEQRGHWLDGFTASVRDTLAALAPEIAVESVTVAPDETGYDAFDAAAETSGDLVAVLAATDELALSVYRGLYPAIAGDAADDSAADATEPATPARTVPDWFFIGGVGAGDAALEAIGEGGVLRASVDLAPYEAGKQLALLVSRAVAGNAQARVASAPIWWTPAICGPTREPNRTEGSHRMFEQKKETAMLKDLKVGFLGGGQMAEAILAGALEAGALQAQNVTVTDVSPERLNALARDYRVATLENTGGAGTRALAGNCDVVVLAVKPQYLKAVLANAGAAFGPGTLIVSIVGGTTLAGLEGMLPQSPVLRVMPNTPMLVRRGCAGIAAGSKATEEHVRLGKELFDAVGQSWLLDEKLIDPLTSVSGCGPAFACLFMEALADGGVEQGLPRDMALQLAAQTLAGTAELMLTTNRHPAQLKDAVCSPGGGTIAGVHALETGGLRATVMDAVAASRQRMANVGRESTQ